MKETTEVRIVRCPRCKGSGKKNVLGYACKCPLCEGTKKVAQITHKKIEYVKIRRRSKK